MYGTQGIKKAKLNENGTRTICNMSFFKLGNLRLKKHMASLQTTTAKEVCSLTYLITERDKTATGDNQKATKQPRNNTKFWAAVLPHRFGRRLLRVSLSSSRVLRSKQPTWSAVVLVVSCARQARTRIELESCCHGTSRAQLHR